MEKKDLVRLIDGIFVPLGFKRKGNSWVLNGNVLSKIINLQKSNYSNSFYINYGYIIRGVELTTTTHFENRLGSNNKEEQKRITNLLDFEIDVPTDQRVVELKKLLTEKIAIEILAVNKEEDLLREIKKLPHLNSIPLVVKKHFNLA